MKINVCYFCSKFLPAFSKNVSKDESAYVSLPGAMAIVSPINALVGSWPWAV